MQPETLERLKQTWNDYQNDGSLGRINLATWLGKHTGIMLDEVERLQQIERDYENLIGELRLTFGLDWRTGLDELKQLAEVA